MDGQRGLRWASSARVSSTGPVAVGQQLADDAHALLGGLAGPVDGLGHALAQGPVVIDERVADVGERQPAQLGDGVVGGDRAVAHAVEQLPEVGLVHRHSLPVWRSLEAHQSWWPDTASLAN